MPLSHDTYKACIEHAMPEGLNGAKQSEWLIQYFRKMDRLLDAHKDALRAAEVRGYGYSEIAATCGVETAKDIQQRCDRRRAEIDAEFEARGR